MMDHKVGWHLGNVEPMCGNCWRIIEKVPPSTITFIPGEGIQPQDIERIQDITGNQTHVIMRPYFAPSAKRTDQMNYLRAVADLLADQVFDFAIPEGYRHLQLFNEPNMPHTAPDGEWGDQWEGFGPEAYAEFNSIFVEGYHMMKATNPSWKVGFTPLTPGNRDVWFPGNPEEDPENVPYYMHGPEAANPAATPEDIQIAIRTGPCYEALSLADEYYAHIYVQNDVENQIRAPWYGLRFARYAMFFPKPMDIWIAENGIAGHPSNWIHWYNLLDDYPEVKGTSIWWLHHIFNNADDEVINVLQRYVEDPYRTEPPPAPVDNVPEAIRQLTWKSLGIAYAPEVAFQAYAATHQLGAPLCSETDELINGILYRIQPFFGGIVYAPVGAWDQTTHTTWNE